MIIRIRFAINTYVRRAPQLFFRREHDKQLTRMSGTGYNSKLRLRYQKITINNKNSLKPVIFIEPKCSKINRIYGRIE